MLQRRYFHIPLLISCLAVFCIVPPVNAEFDNPILERAQFLHQEIILRSQRNINGADITAMWGLFDVDVLRSLNGGVLPLTINNLNSKYGLTDIRIPLADAGEKGDMKTGAIRIEFFELNGGRKDKPNILAVYYHGLGVVPASTFHIFHFKDGRYKLGAAMEKTDFLNEHSKLQWTGIQIRLEEKPGHFSSYFNPPVAGRNRVQTRWHFDGKKLRALHWYPEVDFRIKENGSIKRGRGDPIKLD